MTTQELVLTIAAQVVGAGAGSFFGLKSAINGMRAKVDQTHDTVIRLDEKVNQLLVARDA